jgi:uncharacterized YceG family protein
MAVEPPLRPRPSRARLAARRILAVAVLLALVGVAVWVALAATGGGGSSAPVTTAVAPPPPKPLRIVFPEGFTIAQMAERITAVDGIARRKRHVRPQLKASQYLRLTAHAPFPKGFGHRRGKLEGFMFPALYDFAKTTKTRRLVADQLDAFRRNWAKLDLRYARSKNLTPYDVLIIASMIEKEAQAPKERALVASVIYNRLKAGMPLGLDATIRYGLDVPGTEALRQSQLDSDSPYNTRKHTGLPPTPIGNPGLDSIKAAANPAKGDLFYFVVKPGTCGEHFFTASEQEFEAAEQRYQEALQAEGGSPTNC